MSAFHALRSRARRSALALVGLAILASAPVGCGGGGAPRGDSTSANPKAGEGRREMADFMKTQQGK